MVAAADIGRIAGDGHERSDRAQASRRLARDDLPRDMRSAARRTAKELVGLLRQRKSLRGPRSKTKEKRGGLIGMISIHERPDISGRELPGDWEGDLIKGAGNASVVGTLVERKSRLTILAKMKDCPAHAAMAGLSRELTKVPGAMRRSLAYDQGKEMASTRNWPRR